MTSANYMDSYNNEMCLHSKDLKTTSKSINQNWTCTDAVMKRVRGRGKKLWFFPQKTSYKLGTDVKRGEQVGFFLYFIKNVFVCATVVLESRTCYINV